MVVVPGSAGRPTRTWAHPSHLRSSGSSPGLSDRSWSSCRPQVSLKAASRWYFQLRATDVLVTIETRPSPSVQVSPAQEALGGPSLRGTRVLPEQQRSCQWCLDQISTHTETDLGSCRSSRAWRPREAPGAAVASVPLHTQSTYEDQRLGGDLPSYGRNGCVDIPRRQRPRGLLVQVVHTRLRPLDQDVLQDPQGL